MSATSASRRMALAWWAHHPVCAANSTCLRKSASTGTAICGYSTIGICYPICVYDRSIRRRLVSDYPLKSLIEQTAAPALSVGGAAPRARSDPWSRKLQPGGQICATCGQATPAYINRNETRTLSLMLALQVNSGTPLIREPAQTPRLPGRFPQTSFLRHRRLQTP